MNTKLRSLNNSGSTKSQILPGKTQPKRFARRANHIPNKTFLRSEYRVHKVLCRKIADRRFSVKGKELYREAGISSPTFYQHYCNPEDARNHYEDFLFQEFVDKVSPRTKKSTVFDLLLIFIAQHQDYFLATHKNHDSYLLAMILNYFRTNLRGNLATDQAFYIYVSKIIIIIDEWLEFEKLNLATINTTVDKLLKVSVKR